MSLNGSGVYSPNTAGQPVVSGTTITDTAFNALMNDIATALSTALYKDGQQTVTANIPLGGYKITGLGTGTATTDAAAVQNVNARHMCEGRLTLTTGVPVTTSDVTAAETLYFTAFRGNCIALYDGTNWVRRTCSEASIDVPDVTGVHDVFAYDNAGTVTLEVLVWTDGTNRATALTTQDGVLVKTGDATRRYLGTFYSTTAGNGQIEDSVANRYLWNYYHRVVRSAKSTNTTASWTYTTAGWRQANASTQNQVNMVIGVSEDVVRASLSATAANTSTNVPVSIGIAVDSAGQIAVSTPSQLSEQYTLVANIRQQLVAQYAGYPGIGKRSLLWVEISGATGTTTWYGIGESGASYGVMATIRC